MHLRGVCARQASSSICECALGDVIVCSILCECGCVCLRLLVCVCIGAGLRVRRFVKQVPPVRNALFMSFVSQGFRSGYSVPEKLGYHLLSQELCFPKPA